MHEPSRPMRHAYYVRRHDMHEVQWRHDRRLRCLHAAGPGFRRLHSVPVRPCHANRQVYDWLQLGLLRLHGCKRDSPVQPVLAVGPGWVFDLQSGHHAVRRRDDHRLQRLDMSSATNRSVHGGAARVRLWRVLCLQRSSIRTSYVRRSDHRGSVSLGQSWLHRMQHDDHRRWWLRCQ